MLRALPTHLDSWNASRREAAARYAELGLGELLELPDDIPATSTTCTSSRSPERDRIAAALADAGIDHASVLRRRRSISSRRSPISATGGRSLPETEKAARENLALPLWAGIRPSSRSWSSTPSVPRSASVA